MSISLYAGGAGPAVPREVREAMDAYDRAEARREKKHREHVKTFTDLKADAEKVPAGRPKRGVVAKPGQWEGVRLNFTLLIGIDVIWAGPASIQAGRHCLLCRGKGELPSVAVCVGCGRSGQDHHPELRSARPKPRDNRKYSAGRLKGGVA